MAREARFPHLAPKTALLKQRSQGLRESSADRRLPGQPAPSRRGGSFNSQLQSLGWQEAPQPLDPWKLQMESSPPPLLPPNPSNLSSPSSPRPLLPSPPPQAPLPPHHQPPKADALAPPGRKRAKRACPGGARASATNCVPTPIGSKPKGLPFLHSIQMIPVICALPLVECRDSVPDRQRAIHPVHPGRG
jgi:hypothetical protein